MSTKSTRINILVTPEEKAAIEYAAAQRNVTLSDHVREAATLYEPEFNMMMKFDEADIEEGKKIELGILTNELAGMIERLTAKLDKSFEEIEKIRREHQAFRKEKGLKEI